MYQLSRTRLGIARCWLDPPEKVKLRQPLNVIVDLARDSALELLNSRHALAGSEGFAVGSVARCGPVSRSLRLHSGAVERDA